LIASNDNWQTTVIGGIITRDQVMDIQSSGHAPTEPSESAIVAPYEGGRGLMFRIVNAKPSELSDVQVRVNLALFEEIDGKRARNFHQLALERNTVEFFTLHWTVVHPITADSPLHGATPDSLREAQAELLILVNAHEETFSTRVTARASYWWDEIRWDAKFASIFAGSAEDVLAIDVDRLDRLDRLEPGTTSKPAPQESATPTMPTERNEKLPG